MLSVVGFTAASFLCGLAPTLGTLILFRILQKRALQPLSQAVLLEAFAPQIAERHGLLGPRIVVAPILGPVLGGWLTDNYSWRWSSTSTSGRIASIVMTKRTSSIRRTLRTENRTVDYWGSACSRSASARCRSCSTRGSRKTGSNHG